MKETLLNILYIIVAGCGTAVATFLCAFIKSKINEATDKIKNEKIQKYLNAATDSVTTAVLTVSQTYVDALKRTGGFTEEAQNEAKNKAIEIATGLITEDGKAAVEAIYGDFTTWLCNKIEADVKANK